MTESKEHIEKKKQKVEELGIFFEQAGFAPMSGRVFAFLLLSEPPYRDFYAIQEFLAASKSSISNALNTLMGKGIVDYITFSGDRKRYFRVNPEGWLDATKERIKKVSQIRNVIEEVLEERSDTEYQDFNKGLKSVVDFLSYFSEELEHISARWEAKHAKK